LVLNKHILAAAYQYLASTPPFYKWNLPDAEDVAFRVTRTPRFDGEYMFANGQHYIFISSAGHGHTNTLMKTMAHEMIHLHEQHAGACGKGEHSRAFVRWCEQVCRIHGWDVKSF
jgi:hypothetical protein